MSSAGSTLEGTMPASQSSQSSPSPSPPKTDSDPDYFSNDLAPLIQELAAGAGANHEDGNVTGKEDEEVTTQMEVSYDPSLSLSQCSSVSSSDDGDEMNEEDVEMMIDLIESELKSEESLIEEGEVDVDEDSYDSTHSVEYWSVGKGDTPKTLLKRYSVLMKR